MGCDLNTGMWRSVRGSSLRPLCSGADRTLGEYRKAGHPGRNGVI